MDRESLLTFVRFHAWANDRILSTAAELSDEELLRPSVLDHDSAFHTIRHLVDVDWSWREFCQGNDVGNTYVWDHGFVLDDLPALHGFSLEEDRRLRSYLESLADTDLAERLAMSEDPNDRIARWLIIAHVVNHGTQHRSELAHYFTTCGHSPGDIDLLDSLTLPWPGDG
jgi:uncharacterized damage-inducible protein DinB